MFARPCSGHKSSTEVDSDEFNYDQTPRKPVRSQGVAELSRPSPRPLKILKKPAMAKAKAASDKGA